MSSSTSTSSGRRRERRRQREPVSFFSCCFGVRKSTDDVGTDTADDPDMLTQCFGDSKTEDTEVVQNPPRMTPKTEGEWNSKVFIPANSALTGYFFNEPNVKSIPPEAIEMTPLGDVGTPHKMKYGKVTLETDKESIMEQPAGGKEILVPEELRHPTRCQIYDKLKPEEGMMCIIPEHITVISQQEVVKSEEQMVTDYMALNSQTTG